MLTHIGYKQKKRRRAEQNQNTEKCEHLYMKRKRKKFHHSSYVIKIKNVDNSHQASSKTYTQYIVLS